jgi:hypothetical protein
MGLFDTYVINCPHCGEQTEDQKKPGYLNTYIFGEDPVMDLDFEGYWICYKCQGVFNVELESVPKMVIKKIEKEV